MKLSIEKRLTRQKSSFKDRSPLGNIIQLKLTLINLFLPGGGGLGGILN